MREGLSIVFREGAAYPSHRDAYAPSKSYPEYTGKTAAEDNPVYDMVREGFRMLRMDAAHMDTSAWNPLGEIIRPGDTVLLKPNFVMHENLTGGLDCLVTHPSVIRAVLDYVLIATKGSGIIIIGDAPVQSCDFNALLRNTHYDLLEELYGDRIFGAGFHDFRNTVAMRKEGGVLQQEENSRRVFGCRTVRLDRQSAFAGLKEERLKRLRITNYRRDVVYEHHHAGCHEYLISDALLQADVVINLPKPKTHRKAGVTGAMKNMIGINASKEYLPHHTAGAGADGGDEYRYRDRIKAVSRRLQESQDDANARGAWSRARGMALLSSLAAQGHKLFKKKDPYSEGSWYGNDTIWRTIADISRIVRFAAKDGVMRDTPQRKLFVIADMIVSGVSEGPLNPSPWEMHRILMAEDPAMADYAVTRLFGLPAGKIPTIRHLCDPEVIRATHVLESGGDETGIPLSGLPKNKEVVPLPAGWRGIMMQPDTGSTRKER